MERTRVPVQRKMFTSLLFLLVISVQVSAITPSGDTLMNRKRLRSFTVAASATYGLTLTGLYQIWYKDSERQRFQFFNDAHEWKQTDKAGHFFSTFYLSYLSSRSLQWADVERRRADLAGAAIGFLALLPVEIFDGYSAAYGASATDLGANALGASFFWGQTLLWNEVRIQPKYSFHRTRFAPLRPELLGNGYISEVIKDYNGQTQWLSFHLDKFDTRFPTWLNIAVGYGAEGMIYAQDAQNIQAGFDPYRQYYLSIDFDLTSIRTRSKFVRTLIFLASAVKLPAPTLEMSRKGITFKPFYF